MERQPQSQQYPDAEVAVLRLLENRQQLGHKLGTEETAHTPPASHYPHIYFWDSCFAAIINARHGGRRWVEAAATELETVVEGQHASGFIPNMQFAEQGRSLDLERVLVLGRSAKGSNYTQPPVLALAVAETYGATLALSEVEPAEAIARADSFLHKMYPALAGYYRYLDVYRSNQPNDKLIGIIHPHETGRDSDPTFDLIKPRRMPRNGVNTHLFIDKANSVIDYAHILGHGIRLQSAQGEIARAREIFWVNDVMMNCMYADNLQQMAELARQALRPDDAVYFSRLTEAVEKQILTKMWFPEARAGKGMFYALDENGQPIQEVSVSNLFPLVLSGLEEEQLESLLDLLDTSFNTAYPLPSVATNSRNYDPHNRETDRLWRGPTWINTNWYIAERGLKKQAVRPEMSHRPDLMERCHDWALRLAVSSKELVDNSGGRAHEHYNPITGSGQRRRVRNFAWSYLAYVMTANA